MLCTEMQKSSIFQMYMKYIFKNLTSISTGNLLFWYLYSRSLTWLKVKLGYIMLFPAKINKFGFSTSNNAGRSKIYSENRWHYTPWHLLMFLPTFGHYVHLFNLFGHSVDFLGWLVVPICTRAAKFTAQPSICT